jgi:putative ABC transport system permease protein
VAPTQVDASTGARQILVPGRLVGLDVANNGPHIDTLQIRSGRALTPADAKRNVVALDSHFADYYHLPAQGRLRLSGGVTVEYVAHALSPEYFMVMGTEGTMHAEPNFAVMFASNETVQRLTGHTGKVNEAVVRVTPGTNRRAAAAAIEASLRTRLPNVATTVTALEDERAYKLLYADIDGDQRLYTIFAFLVLGGAAFAAFNLVGRIVEAQRREIGVGMSLGVPPAQIAIRPVLVGFQVALLGAVLGVLVGLGVGALMLDVMKGFLPLPVWRTSFAFGPYLRGWAIGLLVPFVATLIPVMRAIRVEPVDAIRTGPGSTRRSGLAPLLGFLTVGNSLRRMPLRNVLRAPRRTLLTAFAIAAAIATLIGVIGMVDSFTATIDQGEAAVLGNAPDRLTVGLSGFALRGSDELRAISTARGVKAAEPQLQVGGTLHNGRHEIETMLRLLPFDSTLWTPNVAAGHLDTTTPGVVIAKKAASDLGVSVGDKIELEHPLREGAGYKMATSRVRVEAIHDIPYRFIAFMDIRDASLMNLDGIYNAVAVEPQPNVPIATVERTLFTKEGVASVQPVRAFAQTIRDLMAQMLNILRVIEGAVLLLAVLIAFNSSAISVDERAREHATMFAFGVPVRRVLGMTVIESAIIGGLGTALGIAFGRAIVEYITRVLLPSTMPDVTVQAAISSVTIWTAIVLGMLAVSIAPLFTVRRLRRMDVPSTLRVVE